MHGSYNPYLVALSLLVAVLVSYTMLDLAGRIRRIQLLGSKRTLWLLGGAVAMGGGIWSMHFIGMLACKMPMELSYDPWITGLSLGIAICISFFALNVITRSELRWAQLGFGGTLMGVGIVSMHYAGMLAIRIRPGLHYRPALVVASIAIALTASWAAMWIAFTLRDETRLGVFWKRSGAALVMGVAIAGMHYVGMNAAIFPMDMVSMKSAGVSEQTLVVCVASLSFFSLTITLIVSGMDSRFDRLTLLSGQALADAERDVVTGLPGRAVFLEKLGHSIAQAEAKGTILAIMILDLDGFRAINDSLGFAAGDELLRSFSVDLVQRVRAETFVARLSGDEFALLSGEMKDIQAIASIAKSIFDRLQTSFRVDHMPLHVTASAGIAVYPQDGSSVAGLLKGAGIALDVARRQGKNTYRFFSGSMSEEATKALHINRSIGDALEKGQFKLVYQPKFDGSSLRLTGAEALIRWAHPVLGNIPPMEFIPIAEETGQILQISNWVIDEVCRQLRAWEKMGLSPIKIAINLSPEQLRREGYSEQLAERVIQAGVAPTSILFEITEGAAMHEPERVSEVVHALQGAGFAFAIDDFGTGYSSMAYLQRFRVKELKIDRFFISSLEHGGEEAYSIVAAIIALAHALRMTVVAEGVETENELAMLKALRCDEIQGYLLGRPMPPANLETLLHAAAHGTDRAIGPIATYAIGSSPVLHSAIA